MNEKSRTLLFDARPEQGSTGQRGVGQYVAARAAGIEDASSAWTLVRARSEGDRARGGQFICRAPGPDVIWSRILGPRWLRASGADLYHATFLAPFRVPRGFPWVSTIHDLIPLRHPGPFSRKQLTVFRLSLRWNARATRVVAVSPYTAGLVKECLGAPERRIRVVPPPVRVGRIEDALASSVAGDAGMGERFLLHCSGFDPLKGVTDLLLPAMTRLSNEHPGLHLVMTGPESEWRARAERAATDLGIGERVLFPGLVSEEERAALLRHASALVVCSREEGFGIPAIEGLAAGLPVVVGPAEATRWAVGEHRHLSRDDTPEGLADAIREALEAPGSDDAAAAETRRSHARRFAPAEIARQMIEVYEEALR